MYGPRKDVEGECNAQLHIGDDYGDNRAMMRCQLGLDHNGPHVEKWTHDDLPAKVEWWGDDRPQPLECANNCGATTTDWIEDGWEWVEFDNESPTCPTCKKGT